MSSSLPLLPPPFYYTLSSLAALIILSLAYSRLCGLFGADKKMSVTVKWGRERLQIPLPSPDTKLSVFRQTLSEHTHLPPDSFKLIHAGAVMKDDNAPLSAYKLQSGGTLLLLDSKPAASPSPAPPAASKPPKTEASTIQAIQVELASVRGTLEPSVDAFLRTPTLDAEHTRLGELLLQALLRLDALTIDSTWVDARRERKGAVRAVQGLLDRLDKGWREARAQQNGALPQR